MADVHEAFIERNIGLRQEAQRCRAMWATVVLNAINDTYLAAKNAIEDRNPDRAEREFASFRRWAISAEGKLVLSWAGIDPSRRAIERLIKASRTGVITKGRLAPIAEVAQ